MAKWNEIKSSTEDFQLPKVDGLLDKAIQITGVRFETGGYGEYAVIRLDEGSEYRTSSQVLIGQLLDVKDYIEGNDDTVETTIQAKESENGRTYYTLV